MPIKKKPVCLQTATAMSIHVLPPPSRKYGIPTPNDERPDFRVVRPGTDCGIEEPRRKNR